MLDIITSKGIEKFLTPEIKNKIKVEYIEQTESTNDLVKKRAISGEQEGLLVVAGKQVQGRGRMGRQFFSPDDTGIYMSLLLRPEIKPCDAIQITTAAAVSVCDALEQIGAQKASIKWVNDIFVNKKKVCGILTEASFNSKKNTLDYAVLGVGVNMYLPDNGFPEELKDIAGAVFTHKKENLKNEFVACFLNSFMNYYNNLDKKLHSVKYAENCFVVGQQINVITGDTTRLAKALSIDENCGLLVQFETGEKAVLNSGEISVRAL